MKRGRGAIARLVRWRGLQESCAADAYRSRAAETAAEDAVLATVRETLADVRDRRLTLLDSGELDLARLQVFAEIETDVERSASEQEQTRDAAREREALARSEHAASRSRTRVADSRHARVLKQARERDEKVQFDRMADLHAAARRKP